MKKNLAVQTLCALVLVIGSTQLPAQHWPPEKHGPLDGKAFTPPPVRYADVMWMQRVWRRIDVRQKMNHTFALPETPNIELKSFFDYVVTSVLEGALTAYSPGALGDDDMFTTKMTYSELIDVLQPKKTILYTPLDGSEPYNMEITVPLEASDVVMYELKEDWFFDRQRSVMDVRIVGICPLVAVVDEAGEFRGYKKLFWISFEEARQEMAYWSSFNRGNDAERRTYLEVFTKRMFDSYIVKESNVYDRYIQEYASGEDALFEAERIKNKLFIQEHDLWEY